MTKPLPGWMYMLVGLAIMGYTKFIQAKQPTTKIGFFLWVGLAFLIFGVLREFVPRMLARRTKKEQVGPPMQSVHQAHLHPSHGSHQHLRPQQHPSHPYQPMHKQCPRCHQLTHGNGRYCHHCGHQFF